MDLSPSPTSNHLCENLLSLVVVESIITNDVGFVFVLLPPDGRFVPQLTFLFHICSPPLPVLTENTGSEENIDISVLGLHSKLNLPLKFPLSHNHKPEAYPSRPGHSYTEQILVDGGYIYNCVCVCVYASV